MHNFCTSDYGMRNRENAVQFSVGASNISVEKKSRPAVEPTRTSIQ
jgi:hypothetical protein